MKNLIRHFKLVVIFLIATATSGLAQTTTFSYTGTIVSYTVPAGVYNLGITANGAQGGQGQGAGGRGAIMTGTFTCTPGHVLKVLVGQQPTVTASHYAAGGGGGSFVWDATAGNTLLIAAGGGGGGGYTGTTIGVDAVTTANGTNGGAGATYGGAGTAGHGATTPSATYYAGGGAGWLSNGANGNGTCTNATGGIFALSATTPGAGGSNGGTAAYDGPGGFGGGGGAEGLCLAGYGGGGGGYSGGGAGCGSIAPYVSGGGGGSYNSGTSVSNSVGNMGNGSVTITTLCFPPTGGSVTGPTQVCVGAFGTLYDASGSAGGSWTSSNPSIATIGATTGFITGDSVGVDTLTYTVVRSCGTASASYVVTINPLPAAIAGYSDVCPGSTMTLTDSTPGGTWSSSFSAVATINAATGLVTGVGVGSTTISYQLTSTGCVETKTVSVAGIAGLNQVCDGDSFLMTPTVTDGFWSSEFTSIASVDSAGYVTGVSLGLDTIGYSLPSGCTLRWPVTVNAMAPILGTDSVCTGSIRYLTNIVGGGTWTSSTPSVATVRTDSGKVTGISAGTTVISYLLPTGCLSTVSFGDIDYPVGIAGTTHACPGSSTALVDPIGGGSWYSGNTSVATVDPVLGVVTGVSPDTVDIYYSIAPGCASNIRVTINPLPAPITATGVVCPGKKDTVYDASPYGTWSTITPSIATVDTWGVVTTIIPPASAPGPNVASIRYTLPVTGCFQTFNITVDQLPTPAIVNYDGTLYTNTGYASYQWYDSLQGKINGATAPNVAALFITDYYVVVTDSNGCKGASAVYYNSHISVGVNALQTHTDIHIYPNPTEGMVHISSPVTVRACVTDLEGRSAIEKPQCTDLDLGPLAPGMYVVSLFDENGVRVFLQKVVKQ